MELAFLMDNRRIRKVHVPRLLNKYRPSPLRTVFRLQRFIIEFKSNTSIAVV